MAGVLDAALRTDRYEVTMIDAALESGIADRRAVFEVFTRRLPAGRRYGVVAGTARVVEAIEAFRFTPDHIDFLSRLGLSPRALRWLAGYRFHGDVWGYPEGEVYFAIESPRGQLSTYVVSDGSPKPYRVHFRAPSFINLQALPHMAKGRLVADLVALIASMDPVLGEVDR